MNSIVSENGQEIRKDFSSAKKDAGDTTHRIRSAAGQEVSDLMADVQDLVGRIAHVNDPDVVRLRAKVEGALSTAKTAISEGSDRLQRHAKDALNAGDGYVRDQPWQAVGIAAATGLLVGFLVARR
jgi:ElaB/YqjD/DUF883 family membrane-anchored ribosome-binding protein